MPIRETVFSERHVFIPAFLSPDPVWCKVCGMGKNAYVHNKEEG